MITALVQYDPEWEDKERNKQKLNWLLENNFKQADLLIFPEMTLTGFTMSPEKFSEKENGESFDFFSEIASKYECNILAGLIIEQKGSYFNSLLHIDKKGKLVTIYKKLHPFSYSKEDKYYSKGDNPVTTKIEGWNVGLTICYDLRFPELYRLYAKERTELIVNIANWPVTRIEHWKTLLKARAIENQCYIIGVNRVGNGPQLAYNGFCSVIDPMGVEVISGYDEEKIILAEINKDEVSSIRKELPFLDDIHLI